MQITITENTAEVFENLTLPELLYPLQRMGRYRIGEIQNVNGIETAVGILIFDVTEKKAAADIELIWLYVAEEYRKKGVGKSLLNAFFNIVNGIHAQQLGRVKCTMPCLEEFEDLKNFLQANYFFFKLERENRLEISLDRLHQCDFAQKQAISKQVVSLQQLTRAQWSLVCQLMGTDGRRYDHHIEAYERSVSAVFLVGNEPDSVILFYKNADSQMELVCLQAASKNKAAKLAELICFSIQNAWNIYGESATVLVDCNNPVVNTLGKKYFPEVQLQDEWMGIYRLIK